MSKLYTIQLTDEQRSQLEHLIAAGTHKARVQARARVLLLAEKGLLDRQIAEVLHIGPATVERIRKRFVTLGFEQALHDKPRPGRPVRVTGEIEAKLVMLACSSPPEGRSRWTLQLLADKMVELGYIDTLSDGGVRKLLKKTSLSLG